MKRKKSLSAVVFAFILLFSLSSCLMTRTSVGTFRESRGSEYIYAKGKQFWLFWGIVPLGRTSVNTPGNGSCEVITKFTPSDVIISVLTGGIVTSYSIKVKAKRQ